jgi:hypothetical protein
LFKKRRINHARYGVHCGEEEGCKSVAGSKKINEIAGALETRSGRPATTLLLVWVNHPVDDFLTGYEVSSSQTLWKSHGRRV